MNQPQFPAPPPEGSKLINAYTCHIGHRTITRDLDRGVTPMFLNCRHEGCNARATSAGYLVDQDLTPTHEWYRPGSTANMTPGVREHVEKGGLILRRIDGRSDQPPPAPRQPWKSRIKALRKKQ